VNEKPDTRRIGRSRRRFAFKAGETGSGVVAARGALAARKKAVRMARSWCRSRIAFGPLTVDPAYAKR
jgi:hypothetical protein